MLKTLLYKVGHTADPELLYKVLCMVKQDVMMFESKTLLIHKLHDEQIDLFKKFIVHFIKPEALLNAGPSQLRQLDVDANVQRNKDLFYGSCGSLIKNSSIQDFKTKAKEVAPWKQTCGGCISLPGTRPQHNQAAIE